MPSSSLPLFYSLRTSDPKITPILERLKLIFAQLFSKEIIDGQLIDSITLIAGGTVKVPHKLERAYNGWFIVKIDGFAQVFDNNSNTETEKFIYISSDAAVHINIWVF